MTFIIENQILLIAGCFLLGVAGTAVIARRPMTGRAWKIADLVWVLLGGFGALAAVLAGIYHDDSSRLDRQIDVAFAATRAFDHDAARFRLRYCEADRQGPALRPHVLTLCEKVEFLSASTAGNRDLPLFLDVAERAEPLQQLRLLLSGGHEQAMEVMAERAERLDTAELLAFAAQDEATMAAQGALAAGPHADIAADYQVIAQAYEELIGDVAELKSEWEFLQANARILMIQVIALCLVAFAAPFRLGKSLADLA
ncbi:MAG: hypothetical protein R3D84_17940 [Paracoccaceae bacterium]